MSTHPEIFSVYDVDSIMRRIRMGGISLIRAVSASFVDSSFYDGETLDVDPEVNPYEMRAVVLAWLQNRSTDSAVSLELSERVHAEA